MGGCKVIVVGGMQAGVGKSTVTVGLMAALRQRGLRVQGFKVGPDLLDPLLHEAATGKPSYNLDGWMLTKEHNLSVAQRLAGDADVAVVEGGDGLYDGTFGDEEGSTGQLAKWLGAPVVLVLDCDGLPARSAAALLKGHLAFDDELPIAGVILNKTKDASHEKLIRDSIENAGIGAPIFGALRRDDAGLGMLRDEGQGPHPRSPPPRPRRPPRWTPAAPRPWAAAATRTPATSSIRRASRRKAGTTTRSRARRERSEWRRNPAIQISSPGSQRSSRTSSVRRWT